MENGADVISGAGRVAGVIGWPIGHSLSSRLHGYWLRQYTVDGAYVPLAVRSEDLNTVLDALPRMGFVGWNVTVPHKEAALAAVTEADPAAQRIGAINTVVVAGGNTVGANSDGFGFLENLRAGAPAWAPETGPVVVLGAGGGAKAVAWALADAGVSEIRIANRTAARATELAHAIGTAAMAVGWEERAEALAGASLVVNATSLGMTGQPPLALPLDTLPETAVVNDLVYAPETTELLAGAHARGNPVVDGIGMLLHQARQGFAAWFGVEPQVTAELRAFVRAGLKSGQ